MRIHVPEQTPGYLYEDNRTHEKTVGSKWIGLRSDGFLVQPRRIVCAVLATCIVICGVAKTFAQVSSGANLQIAGPRPWIDVTSSTYTVLGADPTGTNDSTNAFNTAEAACNGGTLFIPDGTYKIGNQLTFNTSCTIQGWGRGATLLRNYSSSTANATVGWLQIGASSITIQNLTINGNSSGSFTGNCIVLVTAVTDFHLTGNLIENCDGEGVGIGATGVLISRIEITANDFVNNMTNTGSAFGTITLRDNVDNVLIANNPRIDGSGQTVSGDATLQMEGSGVHYNHQRQQRSSRGRLHLAPERRS
jgi:hypothetical protein